MAIDSCKRSADPLSGIERLSRQLTAAAAAAILAFGLAACTAGEDQDTTALPAGDSVAAAADAGADDASANSTGPQGDSVPADEREAAPGAVMGAEWTAADTGEERPVTGAALLRALRTARHDGFDRIVLDFGDDDVPGYRISYIDRPVRQCGSGNEVPLAGEGWLSITAEPANAHTDEGEPTIRERERAPGLPVLLELKMICDFEAMVEVVAGVASPERYRSFVLASPNRLVVDIMHPE